MRGLRSPFAGAVAGVALLLMGTSIATASPARNIDMNATTAIQEGREITGTVSRRSDGAPLADVAVWAHEGLPDADGWWPRAGSGRTDSNGAYTIPGLLPGAYRLEFVPERSSGFLGGYWSDAGPEHLTHRSPGTAVVVAGADVSVEDASLARGHSISGTLTAANGVTPLKGWTVTALNADERVFVETKANGTYTLRALPDGDYALWITKPSDEDPYFGGCYTLAGASHFSGGLRAGPDAGWR